MPPPLPRCRRCRRPIHTEASKACGLGTHCLRLLRRRRRLRRPSTPNGFPPIAAYRTRGQIPGQTMISIDDRRLA